MMDVYMTYCVEILDRLLVKREHQNRPQMMDVLGMVKTCHVCLTILRFPNRTTTSLWTFWQPRATKMVKFGHVFPCYENLQQCQCLITKFPPVLDVHGMSRFSLFLSDDAPNEHTTNTHTQTRYKHRVLLSMHKTRTSERVMCMLQFNDEKFNKKNSANENDTSTH